MNSDESLGKRLFQISGNAIGVPLPNSQVSVYASTETVIQCFAKTQAVYRVLYCT